MPQIEALIHVQNVMTEDLGPTWQVTVIINKNHNFEGMDDFMVIGVPASWPDGEFRITSSDVGWNHPRKRDPD